MLFKGISLIIIPKEACAMENKAHQRYKWLCLQLEEDREMLYLREKLRLAQPELIAAVNALPPELRENIMEFIGILGEISDRTTGVCCYVP